MPRLTRRSLLFAAASAPALITLPARAATHQVTIASHRFTPAELTIARGDTVRWTNTDAAPHTATLTDASQATPRLGRGQSGELTFARAGTFDYGCALHPSMRGRVVVR